MDRKEIKGPINDTTLNNTNHNFKELYDEFGNVVDTVSEKAYAQVVDAAKLNWKNPVDSVNDLPGNAQEGDTRMTRNNGKVYRYNGVAWAEIQEINVGPVNEVDSRLTSQLAENKALVDTLRNARTYVKYGNVLLPNDFNHNINFKIYRDVDSEMKHDFNIDNELDNWNAVDLYVDNNGSSSGDGLTPSTAVNTLDAVIDIAENGNGTHYIIHVESAILDKDKTLLNGTKNITKNIAIVSDSEATIGNIEKNDSYVEDDGVYRMNRSAVRNIYDNKFKTIANLPRQYEKKQTLQECKDERGTWFTDGSDLYINRLDGSKPISDEVFVSLATNAVPAFSFRLGNDVKFVFKNINILHYFEGSPSLSVTSDITRGHLIMSNSKIIESGGNGLGTDGIRYTWLFDMLVTKTKRDGFNYHNTIDSNHFVLEFNCHAFECGVNDVNNNNNCTTGHEAAHILRVNSKGWLSKGPLLADVNGCYSICYDCDFTDSVRDSHPTEKTAYQFAHNGKAIMINCGGGGEDTTFITTAGGFDKVQVQNLRGNLEDIYQYTTLEFIS